MDTKWWISRSMGVGKTRVASLSSTFTHTTTFILLLQKHTGVIIMFFIYQIEPFLLDIIHSIVIQGLGRLLCGI